MRPSFMIGNLRDISPSFNSQLESRLARYQPALQFFLALIAISISELVEYWYNYIGASKYTRRGLLW